MSMTAEKKFYGFGPKKGGGCRRRRRKFLRGRSNPGKRAVQLHRLQPDALRRQAGAEAEVENHQFRLKSLQPVLARFKNFFALVLFFN